MSHEVRELLFTLLSPAVIAVTLALLPWPRRPRSPGTDGDSRHLNDAAEDIRLSLALTCTVLVAFVGLYGWPNEQWHWLMWTPVAGLVFGMVWHTIKPGWAGRVGLTVVMAAASTCLIWPVIERESLIVQLIPIVGIAGLFAAIRPLAARGRAITVCLSAAAALAGISALCFASGFYTLSLPVGAGAMALVTWSVVRLARPSSSALVLGPATVGVLAGSCVLAPYIAWLYATSSGVHVPAIAYVMAGGALLIMWIDVLPVVRRQASPVRALIVVLTVVAVGGTGAVLAALPTESPRDTDAGPEWLDVSNHDTEGRRPYPASHLCAEVALIIDGGQP